MIKKSIRYTDYNGNERVEDFYFNLNKAEATEMELSTTGGMKATLEKIINEQDSKNLISIFKEIILKSYGEKSVDGKRFIKSKELSQAFEQTEAYVNLFMELSQDADKAAEFVNGILSSLTDNSKLQKAKDIVANDTKTASIVTK